MGKYQEPHAPYVESRYIGGRQRVSEIVLFPSFTSSDDGAALGLANAWHSVPGLERTGHYTVDEEALYRTCAIKRSVEGSILVPKGAVGIAICAEPASRKRLWSLEHHGLVLKKTADLVAEICLSEKIRPKYIAAHKTLRGPKLRRVGGIYVHKHEDWPHDFFLSEVKARITLKTLI